MSRRIKVAPNGKLIYDESMFSSPSPSSLSSIDCASSTAFPDEDRINHPSHYAWLKDLCGIEVIDITRHMDFDLGNAIKYLLRQGKKPEKGISDKAKAIEDLKKAIFYINDKIKMLELK